jgi:hypothetical protein
MSSFSPHVVVGPVIRRLALRVGIDPRHVVVGPFVLSLRCSCHCGTLVGPFTWVLTPAVSSFGPSCCCWAVRVDLRPSTRSLGLSHCCSPPLCHPSAPRAVVGLFALALTPPCRRLAHPLRPWAFHATGSSFPRLCCRVARPVAVQPFLTVWVVLTPGLGVSGGEGRGKGGNELRLLSWLILVMHWLGLPFPGSPLWLLLPLHVVLH